MLRASSVPGTHRGSEPLLTPTCFLKRFYFLLVHVLVKSVVSICNLMAMKTSLTPEQAVSNFLCFLELLLISMFFQLFSSLCSCH